LKEFKEIYHQAARPGEKAQEGEKRLRNPALRVPLCTFVVVILLSFSAFYPHFE
jgi:hypothetical protein